MGGVVSVTVRLTPDEQYRMMWGTGGLDLIRDPDFLPQRGDFWAERLTAWRDPEFAGALAPCDYGLVVVDFVTRRILSYQKYTALAFHHLFGLPSAFDRDRWLAAIESGQARGVRNQLPPSVVDALGGDPAWRQAYRDVPLSDYGQTAVGQLDAILQARARWNSDADLRPWTATSTTAPLPWAPAGLLLDYGAFRLEEGWGVPREWPRVKAVLTDEMGFTLTAAEEVQWTEAMQREDAPPRDRFATALEARTSWAMATYACAGRPMAAAWHARAVTTARALAGDYPDAPCPPLLADVETLRGAYGDPTALFRI